MNGGPHPAEPAHLPDARFVLEPGAYDFVDFGSGRGGSLELYEGRSGGRGWGIELDAEKAADARQAGHAVECGSIFDLPPRQVVRFVTADNVLEHLPTLADVERALALAAAVASDFVLVRHPSFEEELYLGFLGLRQYWTAWYGHSAHVTLANYAAMAQRLGIRTWEVHPVGRILDSDDPAIVPTSSGPGQRGYDPDLHGPKRSVVFDRPVYSAFDIVFHLTGDPHVRLDYKGDPEASIKKPWLILEPLGSTDGAERAHPV